MSEKSNAPDDLKDFLENPAEVQDTEDIYCEECSERILFLMKDAKGNQFSIGMRSILDCLVFGIENGDLPKLPKSWCSMVGSEYHHLITWTEGISYNDIQGSKEAQEQARADMKNAVEKKRSSS